jgi:hypothetical protein
VREIDGGRRPDGNALGQCPLVSIDWSFSTA